MSTKGIEKKKPSGHFNTKGFFCSKKLKNTKLEVRKETKKKEKNNLIQMEHGTRKTCVRKIKTRGKRKTQREQSEKRKKTNK